MKIELNDEQKNMLKSALFNYFTDLKKDFDALDKSIWGNPPPTKILPHPASYEYQFGAIEPHYSEDLEIFKKEMEMAFNMYKKLKNK